MGVDRPVAIADDLRQSAQQQIPVVIARENGFPAISPGSRMIQRPDKFDAQGSRHEDKLSTSMAKDKT
jgi:hypothetical protein